MAQQRTKKQAQSALDKIESVLSQANVLQANEKFYLLHSEVSNSFLALRAELESVSHYATACIAADGCQPFECDVKDIGDKSKILRSKMQLLSSMLTQIARL